MERRDAEGGAARRLHEVVAPRSHRSLGPHQKESDQVLYRALLSSSSWKLNLFVDKDEIYACV